MSKIDELLKNEKFEWKKLGEVCEIKRGRVISKTYIENHKGDFPVYSSQTRNDGEIGRIDTYDFEGEFATWTTDGAYAGTVFYRNGKFSVTNICGLIEPRDTNKLLVKFIVYWLQIEAKKHVKDGSGNPKLMSNVVEKIKIPLPSIETQEKIVKTLDNFTNYVTELQAELQARTKQYEYYRDMLLNEEYLDKISGRDSQNDEVIVKTSLKEIAEYSKGRVPASLLNEKNYVGVENLLKDKLGKVNSNYVPNEGNLIAFNIGDILIGNIRPYLRKIWIADLNGGTNGDVLAISLKEDAKHIVEPRFLYQILASEAFFEYNVKFSKGAKMPRGDKKKILEYEFFLPPMRVQKQIVSILDYFDSIVNNISVGLPKEIELRQKQYEYYRKKLLDFKK